MARARANLPLVASLLTAALCAGLFVAHREELVVIPGLEVAELATLDARFRLRGPRAPAGDITIVAVDEATRGDPARLVAALGRYQPIALGLAGGYADDDALAEAVARAGVVVLGVRDEVHLPAIARRARAFGVLDV